MFAQRFNEPLWNGIKCDKPISSTRQLERQLVSKANVQRSSARRKVMTEAAAEAEWQIFVGDRAKLLREPAEAVTAQVR
jgi:hypothetical protein